MITSPDNPRIRELKKLTQRKYRRRLGKFLVDDPKIIREALNAGHLAEEIYTCLADGTDLFPDAIDVSETPVGPHLGPAVIQRLDCRFSDPSSRRESGHAAKHPPG